LGADQSGTSQAELDDYLGRFRRDGSCDRFFFVCHSAAGALSLPAQPRLHLWTADRLSDAAIDAGLYDWLMNNPVRLQAFEYGIITQHLSLDDLAAGTFRARPPSTDASDGY
jgi:hypothetical protein